MSYLENELLFFFKMQSLNTNFFGCGCQLALQRR